MHTDVSVRFSAVGDGSRTLVTLEHSGWERLADPMAARGEYSMGWVGVIGQYSSRFGDTTGEPAEEMVWLVRSHTPGVQAPEDGNVFAHPDFGEHIAFVSGLVERGLVVGAGPIGGRTGHGMTIIRVPGPRPPPRSPGFVQLPNRWALEPVCRVSARRPRPPPGRRRPPPSARRARRHTW